MKLSYSERTKFEQMTFQSSAIERFRARKAMKSLTKAEAIEIEGDVSFGFAMKFLLGFIGVVATFATLIVLLDVLATGQF